MESESETLVAMADSLKVSDTGAHPDGQSNGNQEEDCFYDCEETFLSAKTSLSQNQTEPTHGQGTVSELQTESGRSPDMEGESAQTSKFSEGIAKGLEPLEKDTVLGEGAYEIIGEDERRMDTDSEFKEEETKPSEYDDEYLQEAEKHLTEEEREKRKAEGMALKERGNSQFKNREYAEAQKSYTDALAVCPVCYSKERAILFSNRAAARMHLEEKSDAISDCTKAIELNPAYVRAILRRAELYEQTEKLDEALEDYKMVLEKDPGVQVAREACCRLPRQIEERNEKLKEEMLGKLKDLGNMILRPFGLSTNNFQVKQDDTGSYSVNFVQNSNNNR